MNRVRALALLAAVAVALGASSLALYTRPGIFIVGHRYWLWKASRAASEDTLRESLERVLSATEYGVNQAETYVHGIEDQRLRIRMWRTLIDIAPNEIWVRHYTRNLQSELSPGQP